MEGKLPSSVVAAVWAAVTAVAVSIALLVYGRKQNGRKSTGVLQPFDIQRCTIGPDYVLLAYRLAALVYTGAIGLSQVSRRGFKVFYYFTVWNWWLLIFYFALATSIQLKSLVLGRAKPQSGATRVPVGERLAAAILHIHLTTIWIIDLVTWFILVPRLTHVGDPIKAAFWRGELLCFTSYNQHGFNSVLVFLDFFLNRIPMEPYKFAYIQVWSMIYGTFNVVLRVQTGKWLYPIYNDDNPATPFILFSSVHVAPMAAFGASYLLYQVKHKLLLQRAARRERKVD